MITKNEVKIQVRAYNVTLRDIRTNETVKDAVILTKEQLKAAHETGLGLEGILTAVYNRKGYHVTAISAPVKKEIAVTLIPDLCGGEIRVDTPERNLVKASFFSGKEIAVKAVMEGGDGLRRYCEYLKAHGYHGDAFDDVCNHAKDKAVWAANVYRKFVTDDADLHDYMANAKKGASV